MLRKVVVILAVVCMFAVKAYANYPYESVCPNGGYFYDKCSENGNKFPCDSWSSSDGGFYVDTWGFAQCNCTSYAAYALNEEGVKFSNSFMQKRWGDAKNWGRVAKEIGILVDNFPVPGDIVYWTDRSGYGHVARIEKVEYASGMNWKRAYISQYNGDNKHNYSEEWITPADKPTGFIHFKSYKYPDLICADHNNGKKICWTVEDNNPDCAVSDLVFFDNEATGICSLAVSSSECSGITAMNFPNGGSGSGSFNFADSEDSQSDPGTVSGDYGKVEMSSPDKSKKKPELYVKELKLKDDKTKYYNDEKGRAKAYSKNVGTDVNKKTDVKIKLYRFCGEKENGDVKEVDEQNMKGENLKSGKTKEEEFEFDMPDDEGKYQYFVRVDTKNAVSEANENNNRLGNLALRVHKRPDIKVKSFALSNSRTQFENWEISEARVTFGNDGGESFNDIPVEWYLDGVHIASDNMRHWNIERGDEKHESISINMSALSLGNHTLRVKAGNSDDKDKGNNEKEISFTIVAPPIPEPDPNPDPVFNESCEYFEVTKIFHDGVVDIQISFIPELKDKIHIVGQTAPNDYWDELAVSNGEACFQNWPTDANPEFSAYYVENGEMKWLVAKACSQFFNGSPDPEHQHFIIWADMENTLVDINQYTPIDTCQYFTLQKISDIYGRVDYEIIFNQNIPETLGFVGQAAPWDMWMEYPISERTVKILGWPKGESIEFAAWYLDEQGDWQWPAAINCPEFFNGNPDPEHQHFKITLE